MKEFLGVAETQSACNHCQTLLANVAAKQSANNIAVKFLEDAECDLSGCGLCPFVLDLIKSRWNSTAVKIWIEKDVIYMHNSEADRISFKVIAELGIES